LRRHGIYFNVPFEDNAPTKIICISHLFLLITIAALGQTDRAFDNIPFDQWLKGGHDAKIDWSLSVDPPVLTELQRLRISVVATVEGSTVAKWQDPGQMVFFLEVRDRQNRIYRTHLPLTLPGGADPAAGGDWREYVCMLAGDYDISAAVYDTATEEHSLRRAKLRVPELHHDPLPDAWSRLPTMENGGQACYDSQISLPLKTKNPVQIDLIVNTPVDPDTSIAARIRVISEIKVGNGSMTAIGLDLANRKVSTHSVVGGLDEMSILGPLSKDSQYMVDMHVLDLDKERLQFFLSEIRRRVELAVPGTKRVLIILSDRRSVAKGTELEPIQATPAAGTRVYYVRCNPIPTTWLPGFGRSRATIILIPGANAESMPPPPPVSNHVTDSLERMLGPLHPRLFDVTTAIEFRHALAAIMNEISQQK